MMPKKGQMCLKGKRREQNGDSLELTMKETTVTRLMSGVQGFV